MNDPQADRQVPLLRRTGSHHQLIVNGRPYLALGGELHNSSSSDPQYLREIWSKLGDSGIGTVIVSAGWEQVEPSEGQFDFSAVDALLRAARERSVRLVLIWFGAFKNAHSLYAPTWVRRDRLRFPRASIRPGGRPAPFTYEGAMPKPVLSVFSPDLLAADMNAYLSLLRHLARHDPDHTVIMVQIQNEVGLLGDSRDRSPLAEDVWNSPLPATLGHALAAGTRWLDPDVAAVVPARESWTETWADVFGDHPLADEMFMSWAFASYVEHLAAAGKKVLPVPAYTNGWLGPQPGQELPGQFPSGGPTARMLPIWQLAAPSLDFLAPDIYIDGAGEIMGQYSTPANPLFVPEAKFRTGDLFLALGRYHAIGYCAFGIEDGRRDSQFATAVRLLQQMCEVITLAQAEDRLYGVLLESDEESVTTVLGGYTVTIRNSARLFAWMLFDAGVEAPSSVRELTSETDTGPYGPQPADSRPFGLVIATAPDEFLLVGQGLTVDFCHPAGPVEIDRVREGRYLDGTWVDGRILNGDERLQIVPAAGIGLAKLTLLRWR